MVRSRTLAAQANAPVLLGRDLRIAYYQAKAHDCMAAAEQVVQPNTKLQFIDLANKYAVLVLRLQNGDTDIADD